MIKKEQITEPYICTNKIFKGWKFLNITTFKVDILKVYYMTLDANVLSGFKQKLFTKL